MPDFDHSIEDADDHATDPELLELYEVLEFEGKIAPTGDAGEVGAQVPTESERIRSHIESTLINPVPLEEWTEPEEGDQ